MPAPTISSFCGTLASSSAPVEETTRFSSMSMPGSRATSEPVAMTMFLVSSVCVLPSAAFTSTLAGRGDASGAVKRLDLVLLEQERDAVDVGFDVLRLVVKQRGKVDARLADLDAHLARSCRPASS